MSRPVRAPSVGQGRAVGQPLLGPIIQRMMGQAENRFHGFGDEPSLAQTIDPAIATAGFTPTADLLYLNRLKGIVNDFVPQALHTLPGFPTRAGLALYRVEMDPDGTTRCARLNNGFGWADCGANALTVLLRNCTQLRRDERYMLGVVYPSPPLGTVLGITLPGTYGIPTTLTVAGVTESAGFPAEIIFGAQTNTTTRVWWSACSPLDPSANGTTPPIIQDFY